MKKEEQLAAGAGIAALLGVLVLVWFAAPVSWGKRAMDAKDQVRMKLSDPESARFTALRVDDYGVCGLVNARGVLGGYEGNRPFLVDHGHVSLFDRDSETRIESCLDLTLLGLRNTRDSIDATLRAWKR